MSDCDEKQLGELNKAVASALTARREWLDSKMSEYAEMQVGEDVYDLHTCDKVGTVSKLYRYWRDRDDGVRDESLSIDYEFQTSANYFDNTSRQPFKLGSRTQAESRCRALLKKISR